VRGICRRSASGRRMVSVVRKDRKEEEALEKMLQKCLNGTEKVRN